MFRRDPFSLYLSNALDSLPNPFEKLVFLGSLRDSQTGRYLHAGWTSTSSPEALDLALRETHRNVFESVANQSLIVLSRQLRKHFQSMGEPEHSAANRWLATESYRQLIPQGCSVLSLKFFVSQVRFALEILTQAPTWKYLQEPPLAFQQRALTQRSHR